MKHLIIGTAGHIDHGKTTLVKALTNIDCDRLKEEKERGITIDLGFAYFDLPSGRRAGIVDVPGHERFIKNMLAGVGGMDLVLLIVAADEGVMPQTAEHLHILSLLQVPKGIVVLTKADLVDEEWLELVLLDVRERVQGTFLEHAPIIPVSSVTGVGLDELTKEIDRLCEDVSPRDANLPFRLPVDRVFTVQGFGTVVTGTLLSGTVRPGDSVEVAPSQLPVRVRGVGVHGKQVEMALAGQRTALNLAGVTVEQMRRGDVLCSPGLLAPTMMLDVRLSILSDVDKMVSNRERVRLYSGTAEILCRVVLLDRDVLLPGESAYAQLRLEEPIAVLAGDRFVLRSYSPMITIGGGSVIDPLPLKRKRYRERGIAELMVLESGSTGEIIAQLLLKFPDRLVTRDEVLKMVARQDRDEALEDMLAAEVVASIRADDVEYLFHRDTIAQLRSRAVKILDEYHRRFPLRAGMPKEELRTKVFSGASSRVFSSLLLELQADSQIRVAQRTVALDGFTVSFTGKWSRPRDVAVALFRQQLFAPPTMEEVQDATRLSNEDARELVDALVEAQELVKVAEGLYFHLDAVNAALRVVLDHFARESELSLAAFRTYIDSSRKYALPLLEYFDQKKITLRVGEVRKLNNAFDSTRQSVLN